MPTQAKNDHLNAWRTKVDLIGGINAAFVVNCSGEVFGAAVGALDGLTTVFARVDGKLMTLSGCSSRFGILHSKRMRLSQAPGLMAFICSGTLRQRFWQG
jgi:hypothetical protein